MKIALRDHQNKSAGLLAEIERDERLHLVPLGHAADILLIDHDVTPYYRNIINGYKLSGAKVYLYPHGATAHLAWDGVWPECAMVDGYLAMSGGQAETMHRYGYTKPVHITGWHWCEIKPFQKATGRKVLFAPIHALNNGFIHPDIYALNRLVHEQLCRMNIDLTVRFIGDLEACGVEPSGSVHYKRGEANNSFEDIDSADYVVSFGTFAYLAVARGKPTIMYRQDIPYFDGHIKDEIREAEHWEEYADFMRYPVDLPAEGKLLEAANIEPHEWKKLFIGKQMKPGALGDILLGGY